MLGHAEGAQAAQQLVKERHWFPGRLGCPGAPAATATTLWTASKDSTHRQRALQHQCCNKCCNKCCNADTHVDTATHRRLRVSAVSGSTGGEI